MNEHEDCDCGVCNACNGWHGCTAVCTACGKRCTRDAGHDGPHMEITAAGFGYHCGWSNPGDDHRERA